MKKVTTWKFLLWMKRVRNFKLPLSILGLPGVGSCIFWYLHLYSLFSHSVSCSGPLDAGMSILLGCDLVVVDLVVVVDALVVVDDVVVRISVTINMSRFLIGRAIGLIKNLIVGVGKASQKILCLQTAVSKHFL